MKEQGGLLLLAGKENGMEELTAFPLNLTQLCPLSVSVGFSGGAVAHKGRALPRLDASSLSPFCSEPLPTVVQWHLVIKSPANTLAGKRLFHCHICSGISEQIVPCLCQFPTSTYIKPPSF